MPIHNPLQRGLSLIEVLVVVAIMSLLALLAASLGGQWATDANVTQAQGLMQQGYAVAKSMALRNSANQTGSAVAATVCFNGQKLSVVSGADCTASAMWNGTFPNNTSVLFAGAAPSCIALTNNALLVGTAATRTCTTALLYSITSGSSNVTNKALY